MAITGAVRVAGLDDAIVNLNATAKRLLFQTKQGLIRAGFYIQREAQLNTPVDTGNLKAGAFVVWSGKGTTPVPRFEDKDGDEAYDRGVDFEEAVTQAQSTVDMTKGLLDEQIMVEIGFSAAYAIFVHEDEEARHEVGSAKFLEMAVVDNEQRIIQIIAGTIKL